MNIKIREILSLSLVCALLPMEVQGQIANLAGSAGAVNQSMGGASTAMPLDAAGSQFWNPAEITELDVNIQPFFPVISLNSSLQNKRMRLRLA